MTTSARTRMARLIGLFASVCVLFYLAGYAGMIADQYPHSRAWTLATVTAEVALALAILIAAVRGVDRWLRPLSFAWALVYVVSELAWGTMWTGGAFALGQWPWHHAYTAIAVIYLIPYLPAAAVLLAYGALVVGSRISFTGLSPNDAVLGILNAVAFGGFTVVIPLTLFGIALRRDGEEASARRHAAAAAAAEAEAIERERVDGLIHDSVMSALLTAGRIGHSDTVTTAASRALADLAALRTAPAADSTMSVDAFCGLFRSSLHFLDPTLSITIDADPEVPSLPVGVARSLTEAAGEAVRNSVRHAGSCARAVAVRVERGEGRDVGARVEVVVADDGRGFRIADVPADRLGLRASILYRMDALAGGAAVVDAEPGRGTRITLRWSGS